MACTKLHTYFVPKLNIETEINVEILMMVVMKDAVRLPGLPPMSLECNARVVNYAMGNKYTAIWPRKELQRRQEDY